MRLKLNELKKIVDETITEERIVESLRGEIVRVLGPSVVSNVKLDRLAEEANYRIDVLERTGRFDQLKFFNHDVLLKFVNSNSVEARKLAARLLPENFASHFKHDKNASVRHAYARRTSIRNVFGMINESPNDYELRYIFNQKRLQESGVPEPKVNKEPFDLYGKRLGNSIKQQKGSELSNLWYESTARKFIQDYGQNLEGNWEEILAKRYCASIKASSGIEVDESKLYKEILKQIKNKEDEHLEDEL